MDWLIQEAANDLENAEEEAVGEEHGGERREEHGVGEKQGGALEAELREAELREASSAGRGVGEDEGTTLNGEEGGGALTGEG